MSPPTEPPMTPSGEPERTAASDVPELPNPWPMRESLPIPTSGSGCGRPTLIGCSLLLALLVGSSILVLVRANDLFEWGFGLSQQQILAALDSSVTPQQQQRLEGAFDRVEEAVTAGTLDPAALPELQSRVGDALRAARQGPLGSETVEELIVALEAVASTTRSP
ncbi:MAG: hypothetical protein AAGK22_13160 [Acidobacteriota bacterium]